MNRRTTLLLVSLLTARVVAAADGDALPVKLVHDFVAPMFDMEAGGVKVGELRGATARYLSATMADLSQFKYTAFNPDQSEQFNVESDEATVMLRQRVAFGAGTIHGVSPEYEITGKDWHIRSDKDEQRITVNDGVRIVFRASIGNILR